jgi:hypothetical protein
LGSFFIYKSSPKWGFILFNKVFFYFDKEAYAGQTFVVILLNTHLVTLVNVTNQESNKELSKF